MVEPVGPAEPVVETPASVVWAVSAEPGERRDCLAVVEAVGSVEPAGIVSSTAAAASAEKVAAAGQPG